MTTTNVQSVISAAQQLSPTEQLEVIEAITHVLQQAYAQRGTRSLSANSLLPANIKRTLPVTDLRHFAADFWPEDESADDINNYVAQQRAADRLDDLLDNNDNV